MSDSEEEGIQTQEKLEAEIVKRYHQGLDMLRTENHQDGREQLEELLHDEILQQKEFEHFKYGILVSLGEYLSSREEVQIKDLNQSLDYLYRSSQIKESFDTLRLMALITRKLGFYPKSLYLHHQALKMCNEITQRLPLFFGICELSYLSSNQDSLTGVRAKLIEYDYRVEKMLQIEESFRDNSKCISYLDEERQKAREMLEQNPLYTRPNPLTVQPFKQEIQLNLKNPSQFMKNLLKLLESLASQSKEQKKNSDFMQGICNTEIIINSKQTNPQKQKSKDSPSGTEEDQDGQWIDFLIKQEKLTFDGILLLSFDHIPEIRQFLRELSQLYTDQENMFHKIFQIIPKDSQIPQITEEHEIQLEKMNYEGPETLESIKFFETKDQLTYSSIIFLFQEIYEHYLSHDLIIEEESTTIYAPINLRRNKLSTTLTNSFVHYYQVSSLPLDQPFHLLTKLELLYDLYRLHKKPFLKPNKQKPQFQQLVSLINLVKFNLLYVINAEKIKDSRSGFNLKDHYLIRYYNIMCLIHSEADFLNPQLSNHCAYNLEVRIKEFKGRYPIRWLDQDIIIAKDYSMYIELKIQIKSIGDDQQFDVIDDAFKILLATEDPFDQKTILEATRLVDLMRQLTNDHQQKGNIPKIAKYIQMIIEFLHNKFFNTLYQGDKILQVFKTYTINQLFVKLGNMALICNEFLDSSKEIEYISMVCLKLSLVKLTMENKDSFQFFKLFQSLKSRENPKSKDEKKREKDFNKQSNQIILNFQKSFYRGSH